MEFITLNNGIEMPILGYGTFLSNGDECEQSVCKAIQAGYAFQRTLLLKCEGLLLFQILFLWQVKIAIEKKYQLSVLITILMYSMIYDMSQKRLTKVS